MVRVVKCLDTTSPLEQLVPKVLTSKQVHLNNQVKVQEVMACARYCPECSNQIIKPCTIFNFFFFFFSPRLDTKQLYKALNNKKKRIQVHVLTWFVSNYKGLSQWFSAYKSTAETPLVQVAGKGAQSHQY